MFLDLIAGPHDQSGKSSCVLSNRLYIQAKQLWRNLLRLPIDRVLVNVHLGFLRNHVAIINKKSTIGASGNFPPIEPRQNTKTRRKHNFLSWVPVRTFYYVTSPLIKIKARKSPSHQHRKPGVGV